MKVKELIEELANLDPEADVLDVAYPRIISLKNEMDRREWDGGITVTYEIWDGLHYSKWDPSPRS